MAFRSPPPKPFLSPHNSANGSTPTAYLTKRASFVREKLVETANRTSSKLAKLGSASSLTSSSSSSSSLLGSPSATGKNLLSKREHAILNEALKHIIVHLRARVFLMKSAEDNSPPVVELFASTSSTTATTLQDARIIASIGESSGLAAMLESLPKFTVGTLCNVVKIILLSSDAPLLPLTVCGEAVFLFHQLKPGQPKVVDVDELRGALGKAPARNIDVLGQLMTLLHEDSTPSGASRLSYAFGPLLFLPRFDNSSKISKEYEGFDVLRSTAAVVAITKQMIEMVHDVFALDDREVICAAAKKMSDGMTLLHTNSTREVTSQPHHQNQLTRQQSSFTNSTAIPSGSTGVDETSEAEGETYEALFDFDAENSNEISIKQGEIVRVFEKGDDGWWSGVNSRGETGLFPANYVGEIQSGGVDVEPVEAARDESDEVVVDNNVAISNNNNDYDDDEAEQRIEEAAATEEDDDAEACMVENAAEKLAKLEAMLMQEREARKRAEASLQTERRRSQEALASTSSATTNVATLAALLQAKTKLNKV